MTTLKLEGSKVTLVDRVEEELMLFFKEQKFKPGDLLPREQELADALGVARSVVREALSRFKMTGMIESRTRKGMVMTEPSLLGGMKRVVNPLWMTENTLMDIMELRVSVEIGMTDSIFRNITPADIEQLDALVKVGEALGENQYAPEVEYDFHAKLYSISGNKSIMEFQSLIHPVLGFVKDKYKDFFEPVSARLVKEKKAVSHEELLGFIKRNDEDGYFRAIRQHFYPYTEYLKENRSR